MKILLLNGSPRENGNTALALRTVAAEIEAAGVAAEIVQLGKANYRPCIACYACATKKDGHCHGVKDGLNDLIDRMAAADGLVLGSPVWFSAATPYLKIVLDRAGMVSRVGTPLFRRKVGAAVIAVRRSGANPVFSEINYWLLIQEMIVPGSTYWNMGFGREPGEIANDQEGMETFRVLGRNLAWTLAKVTA